MEATEIVPTEESRLALETLGSPGVSNSLRDVRESARPRPVRQPDPGRRTLAQRLRERHSSALNLTAAQVVKASQADTNTGASSLSGISSRSYSGSSLRRTPHA
jgi:hypothetical protein